LLLDTEYITITYEKFYVVMIFHSPNPTVIKTDDDPLVLLKKRLAKGEISAEEYVNLKKILED